MEAERGSALTVARGFLLRLLQWSSYPFGNEHPLEMLLHQKDKRGISVVNRTHASALEILFQSSISCLSAEPLGIPLISLLIEKQSWSLFLCPPPRLHALSLK